jgi:hypothetical protein
VGWFFSSTLVFVGFSGRMISGHCVGLVHAVDICEIFLGLQLRDIMGALYEATWIYFYSVLSVSAHSLLCFVNYCLSCC